MGIELGQLGEGFWDERDKWVIDNGL